MLPPEHDNEVDTPDRQAVAQRTTWVSVAVNLLLTLGQVITGFLAGSQGLIADGIHSLSDLVADFVVLLASVLLLYWIYDRLVGIDNLKLG